jgi:hypothetical protein
MSIRPSPRPAGLLSKAAASGASTASRSAAWKALAAGDKGSVLYPKEYQKLEGPWINGVDPAGA